MNRFNSKRVIVLVSCNLVLLLGAVFPLSGQQLPPLNNPNLASKQLDDMRLRGCGVAGLMADLSLWYDIPIGFEVAMNTGDCARLRMDFKQATLVEVLNQFVAEHSEYEWEISNGVVNVFPKEGRRDPILQQILSAEIGIFSIKEGSVTWEVEKALLGTPQVAAVMDSYGLKAPNWNFSGFYLPNVGPNFKIDVSNMSVRSVLNNIVKESKTAKFWSVSRDSIEHTLYLKLTANQENPQKLMRRADFEDLEENLDLVSWDPANR